ncbi:hydantoinase/oxoprolinase family protein [Nocardioides immobilis]|uniref:Hydantoinase/oxoprolinase family protein n=1 Tax=Nocardioides immobilis TaxID=2049295 RepID=A0A417Y7P1_9ACTN|nr:hydantoinase/oxoprolinase family protein [Nocardioides immobilis]
MVGVDVGGTFTDVVAVRDGQIHVAKVPTIYGNTESAVLDGARELGVSDITHFNHASTHGLNAVLTRNLPKIGFLTTNGHRDILDIGRTWRPQEGLTDPTWRRSFGDADRPIIERYLRRGVRERVTADGLVMTALDEADARAQLELLARCNVEGVAICLLNAYINPVHEELLRELAHEILGDVPVSVSSEVSPLAKEFARASTTVIDVLMKLIYTEYARRLNAGLRAQNFTGQLNFADCAAELLPVEVAMHKPFRIVFAGPAAGTMASSHYGKLIDATNLLCCDVGGTSSDISVVVDGDPFVLTTFELEHDLVVNALSNEISSIGAGGGSLVTVNAFGELKVGPGSAGADPGPACYGQGGTQPTMTDACLLIGILDPDGFASGKRLDSDLALDSFASLTSGLDIDARVGQAFAIGVNNIAEGVTNIAVKHGLDPRDFSLMAFGAAGPMLLPAALDLVNAKEVVVPPNPGLFSAVGLTSTDLVYSAVASSYTLLDGNAVDHINGLYERMESELRKQLPDDAEGVTFSRTYDGRLVGQTWETPLVEVPSGKLDKESIAAMIANFHTVYASRSGSAFEMMPVQGVSFRVSARLETPKVTYQDAPQRAAGAVLEGEDITLRYLYGEDVTATAYRRTDLSVDDEIAGPAVIREDTSTTFIPRGQVGRLGRLGEIRIRKA